MEMKKVFLIAIGVLFLSGCGPTAAMLTPGIIMGTSGNVYKSALNFGTNYLIKYTTGKNPTEHALGIAKTAQHQHKERKIKKSLSNLLEKHLLTARGKLTTNN